MSHCLMPESLRDAPESSDSAWHCRSAAPPPALGHLYLLIAKAGKGQTLTPKLVLHLFFLPNILKAKEPKELL